MRMGRELSPITRAFRENEGALKRFLARFLARRSDVDDLAQETFLRAFAAEAGQEIASPKAFLFTTARNLAVNERQRVARARSTSLEDFPSLDVMGSDHQPSGDDQLYSRRKLLVLAQAVSALPEQCRRVFVMRKVHGYSQKQVAAILGVSEGTVEKQLATGLLKTSAFLRQRGYDAPEKRTRRPADTITPCKAGSTDGRVA